MASWGLFDELNSLRREIDDAFRVAGVARPLATSFLAPSSTRRFPLINLSEDEGQICLDALLPGVDPKELQLSLLRETITISGARKSATEVRGGLVHRNEIGSGKFSRTVDLPFEFLKRTRPRPTLGRRRSGVGVRLR